MEVEEKQPEPPKDSDFQKFSSWPSESVWGMSRCLQAWNPFTLHNMHDIHILYNFWSFNQSMIANKTHTEY